MAKITLRKHSWLYYRNTLLAWGLFLITFGLTIFGPNHWSTILWLLILLFLNYMVWSAYIAIHPRLRSMPQFTPAEFKLQYNEVTFPGRDGLTIAGWYIPGSNRAAIILVHASGGGKVFMLNHAKFLAKEGYGVLMIDLRAYGGSQGDTITGVLEANDVLGAVDYLRSRPEKDVDRIGALGVSLGAWTVLSAAAQNSDLRALVLESLTPVCLADHGGRPKTLKRWINYPINWLSYALGDWMAGAKVKEGVLALLPRIAPRPVMLISAGRGREPYFNRLFLEAASEPKTLWEVPRANHAAALVADPEAYSEKVRTFFAENLPASN